MQDEHQQTGPQEYKYWGFISYSHADEKWADWLHKSLETYGVPKQLVGKPTKYGPIPKRAFPIFRDRDELPSSADLGDKLTAALTGSRYLIVICSPRAVASQWVNEEIKTFKSLGREAQVLCLIVDGEPYASLNPQLGLEECFPEPVRYQVDENRQLTDIRTEPLAADARKGKDGKLNARLKLLSGMFNVNFSDLKQRDHERAQRRLKQILAGVSVLFVVFLALGIMLFIEKGRADKAREFAEQETKRAETALVSAQEARREAQANEMRANEEAKRAKKAEVEANKQKNLAVKNEKEAVKQTALALKNYTEANRQRELAEKNEKEAIKQTELAKKSEAEAQRNFLAAETARAQATEQKNRAVDALSISDFNAAARLVEDDKEAVAIAYLARSLDVNPENSSTEARLISLLSGENWSLPRTAPLKHAGPVVDVDYSPDGKHIVTASGNKAQIWSIESGQAVVEPLTHRNPIYSVRYSPDGKRIVTASDPDAQVWDAATGKQVGAALTHGNKVEMARFSQDGSKVATCSSDKTARTWETETGKAIASITVEGPPGSVDFSPDGATIVVGFGSVAQIYDAKSGSRVGAVMNHDGFVNATFGPNGKYVATASLDKTARVWDAKTGAPVTEPLPHDDRVATVTFSPSGLHIVTSSDDGAARIWDIAKGEIIGAPLKHSLGVKMADVSPNGRWVVTSSLDRTAQVWSMTTGKPVLEPIKFNGPVNAARFSRNGRRLVIGSEDQTAQVWTCLSGQPKSEPLSHGDANIYWSAFSSDAKMVVTCGHDRQVRVWDVGTGEQLSEPMVPSVGRPNFAEFSPDDKYLLVGTDDGNVQIWDIASGKPVGSRHTAGGDKLIRAQYSADGKSILVIGNRTASVLDAKTGASRFKQGVQHESRLVIGGGGFNADGSLFVTAGSDKTARIWDSMTGIKKGEPLVHPSEVTDAVFSRDGKHVATASSDRMARFWDLATAKMLSEPMQHDRPINSIDLNPAGTILIAACDDATVRVWRTSTGQSGAEPLQHGSAVKSARFSDDGRLVVSYEKRANEARVWETASWKLVTAPLTHSGRVNSAVFSKDASFVATSSDDKTAQVWQISIPGDAPLWLTELAVTVGGFRMVESGGGTELVLNPWDKISKIREDMKKEGTDKTYAEWGNWFLNNRASRRVSSYATLNVSDYISRKVEAADKQSLEEALDLQPDHALALARLGIVSSDEGLAGFYTDLAVKYEPDNYDALWLRGAVLQRQQNFAAAWPHLERAVKLDPRAPNSFGPEGAKFKSANQGGNFSSGWLPTGWRDNNADKKYTVIYTKLDDGPPATDAAVKVSAKGPVGRAELLGPRFISRATGSRVIEFWARGKRGDSISVYARGFSGRPGDRMPTHASQIVRIDDQWKQYTVPVRAAQDIAAEVVLQFATSSTGRSVDIADVVVRVK